MIEVIRKFLVDIANNEIVLGKEYSVRISIEDGGDNSYIGFCVDVDDWNHKPKLVTRGLRIFRHTNTTENLKNTWQFTLGDICHVYADEPNVPIEFKTYGKSLEDSVKEAKIYFDKLTKLIRKQTSDYKIESAKSIEKERENLLARLSELEGNVNAK